VDAGVPKCRGAEMPGCWGWDFGVLGAFVVPEQ
jgi:hypothetical protein